MRTMFKFSGSLDFMDFTKIIVKYSSKGTGASLISAVLWICYFLLNEREGLVLWKPAFPCQQSKLYQRSSGCLASARNVTRFEATWLGYWGFSTATVPPVSTTPNSSLLHFLSCLTTCPPATPSLPHIASEDELN